MKLFVWDNDRDVTLLAAAETVEQARALLNTRLKETNSDQSWQLNYDPEVIELPAAEVLLHYRGPDI